MRSAGERTLVGYQSTKLLGGLALLQSSSSIERMYEFLPKEHLMWEYFSASYERSVNKERLSKLIAYYQRNIVNNTAFEMPYISFVVYGDTREDLLSNSTASLLYEKERSAVVDGFLTISALSILLGRTDPFTGNYVGKSSLSEEQKTRLASLDIRFLTFTMVGINKLMRKQSQDSFLK
ncbi:hypothetical protein OGZ01_28645 [Vibrio harveyi]|nr:hypothetical protein [Vibrio harveyi]